MGININPNIPNNYMLPPIVGNPAVTGADRSADTGQNGEVDGSLSSEDIRQKKRVGAIECSECASRKYVDGSDDPGVSFKAPTQMNPSEAALKVVSHEMEHYTRESADAKRNNREVLSNSVRIFTSICKECGKTYVSGGETTTVTRGKSSWEKKMEQLVGMVEPKEDPNSVETKGKGIANKAYGLNFDTNG